MTGDRALLVDGLRLTYGAREVLADVALEVGRGEVVAVMGPSGSGKSSLLACACGLTRPDSGQITVGDREIIGIPRRELSRIRRQNIGVVFQHGELLPALTPLENVALPALLDGIEWDVAARRAHDVLDALSVGARDVESAVLSGGERQRVAVARALMNTPDLLLADEPTGALDVQTRDSVLTTVFDFVRSNRVGCLVVTHDPAVAACADRTLRLVGGRLAEAAAVG